MCLALLSFRHMNAQMCLSVYLPMDPSDAFHLFLKWEIIYPSHVFGTKNYPVVIDRRLNQKTYTLPTNDVDGQDVVPPNKCGNNLN